VVGYHSLDRINNLNSNSQINYDDQLERSLCMKKKVIIIGTLGYDFHMFNTVFRDNEEYEVVFTFV